jgi:hypothetical protein
MEAVWQPRGMMLSERDVRPTSRSSGLIDERTLSASDTRPALELLRVALAANPIDHWIARQMEPLMALGPNWDTQGAVPISEPAINATSRLVAHLLRQGVTTPSVVPLPNGGLSVEWVRSRFEFAIEIPAGGGLLQSAAYFRDDDAGVEWEGPLSSTAPRASEVLSHLVGASL